MDISIWTNEFVGKLTDTFGDRVWFVGLQGSYARGEATNTSDIDMVVILDSLSVSDIQTYGAMLDTMPNRGLICGFLSGKEDILNWDPADLFQFYHDTLPIAGSLDCLLPRIDGAAVEKAIKAGAGNLYHGCVHNMLHGKREHTLRGLYKSASFLVQALHFKRTGIYVRHQKELLEAVSGDDRMIVETFLHLKHGGDVDFDRMSESLFRWAQKHIVNT